MQATKVFHGPALGRSGVTIDAPHGWATVKDVRVRVGERHRDRARHAGRHPGRPALRRRSPRTARAPGRSMAREALKPPWWSPCPPGHDIGPWREACEEVARALGEQELPLHYEDIKRTLRLLNEMIQRIPVQGPR